jgi:AcrR family transcriptional regulator
LRRDEIVVAARRCVIRYGFHAASMAEIAKAAHMSVGQIYRYFPNKEAIIHAIVERIVAHRLQDIVNAPPREDVAADLAERLLGEGPAGFREDQFLLLEVTAEATRNPAVAEIARQAADRLHARMVTQFRADFPELSAEEASARLEVLVALVEGTAFRRVTGQRAQPHMLRELYRDTIGRLLNREPRTTPSASAPAS